MKHIKCYHIQNNKSDEHNKSSLHNCQHTWLKYMIKNQIKHHHLHILFSPYFLTDDGGDIFNARNIWVLKNSICVCICLCICCCKNFCIFTCACICAYICACIW